MIGREMWNFNIAINKYTAFNVNTQFPFPLE